MISRINQLHLKHTHTQYCVWCSLVCGNRYFKGSQCLWNNDRFPPDNTMSKP